MKRFLCGVVATLGLLTLAVLYAIDGHARAGFWDGVRAAVSVWIATSELFSTLRAWTAWRGAR